MIELDNFTIGILVLAAIISIMIITAKMYRTYTPTNNTYKQIIKSPKIYKQPINIVEQNRLAQMQIMNTKYQNLADDLIDYNNKPRGLFTIP